MRSRSRTPESPALLRSSPPTPLFGRRHIGVRSRLVIAAQLDVNSSAADAFLGEDCASQTQLDLGQLENMLHSRAAGALEASAVADLAAASALQANLINA